MNPTQSVDRQIPLKPDMPPLFSGIFRLSQLELRELKRQLDQLLRDRKIKPSTSPYGALVLPYMQDGNIAVLLGCKYGRVVSLARSFAHSSALCLASNIHSWTLCLTSKDLTSLYIEEMEMEMGMEIVVPSTAQLTRRQHSQRLRSGRERCRHTTHQYLDDIPVCLQPPLSTLARHYLGPYNDVCPHYGALHWKAKRLNRSTDRSIHFGTCFVMRIKNFTASYRPSRTPQNSFDVSVSRCCRISQGYPTI
jgi:hypothetical protein